MKTIFYSLAVAAASFFITANASAQYRNYDDRHYLPPDEPCRNSGQQSFYYYPQSNVYYSIATGQFVYFDQYNWIVTNRLPHHIRIWREPHFLVYHNGFDVWNENRFHVMKYRDNRCFQPDMAYDPRNDDYNYPERRDDNWHR